jgi:hypothetical protein
MFKLLIPLGLLIAGGLLYRVGLPNLTRPEFGFVFLIAVACGANWLLQKVPGQYKSPRCPNCGRYTRS